MEMTIKEFLDGWKGHESIKFFLRDNPELIECPIESQEVGGKYPSPESWEDYSTILDMIDGWGDDRVMTLIAKHFLGPVVAIIFPKYYVSEWPRVVAKQVLMDIAER